MTWKKNETEKFLRWDSRWHEPLVTTLEPIFAEERQSQETRDARMALRRLLNGDTR